MSSVLENANSKVMAISYFYHHVILFFMLLIWFFATFDLPVYILDFAFLWFIIWFSYSFKYCLFHSQSFFSSLKHQRSLQYFALLNKINLLTIYRLLFNFKCVSLTLWSSCIQKKLYPWISFFLFYHAHKSKCQY